MKTFDIHIFFKILKNEYKKWNAPVITLITNIGNSPFEVLVSTLLSLRTKDKITFEASKRLLKAANTPIKMLKLKEEKIKKLIYPVGFYPTKAKRLLEISRILIGNYNHVVPSEIDELLKLPGVGRKTANLVISKGYKKKRVCVDTHVHRITNRIGYVKTKTCYKTEFALLKKLPKQYWGQYNTILVAFGQAICRPISPFCSKCSIEYMCPKKNVEKHR